MNIQEAVLLLRNDSTRITKIRPIGCGWRTDLDNHEGFVTLSTGKLVRWTKAGWPEYSPTISEILADWEVVE